MDSLVIEVETGRSRAVVDITDQVARFVADKHDGLCSIFVPHATAGVALMESGSGSEDDLLSALDAMLPRDDRWQHRHGSAGHGADHVLPAIVSPSLTVPVRGGRPMLGVWQSIVLVDMNIDNPRRQVRLSFLDG